MKFRQDNMSSGRNMKS